MNPRDQIFRRLHQDGLLVLANAWDAGSARLIESLGARAIATTSCGVAWSHGIFVPGVTDATEIRSITSATRMPLNVMARAGLPQAPELEALGVRRLSAGGDLAEAAFGRIASLAAAFLRTGASEPLADGAMPYDEINALMPAR